MTKKTKVSTIYSVITQNICLLLDDLISILKKKCRTRTFIENATSVDLIALSLGFGFRYDTKAGKQLPSQVHLCIVNRDNKLC